MKIERILIPPATPYLSHSGERLAREDKHTITARAVDLDSERPKDQPNPEEHHQLPKQPESSDEAEIPSGIKTNKQQALDVVA